MGLQTPEKIRTFQRKLYLKAKSEWMPHDVCLKEKPVGKPDAGDPHVRFDERGWETESR
jgi:hypothetical protein